MGPVEEIYRQKILFLQEYTVGLENKYAVSFTYLRLLLDEVGKYRYPPYSLM